MTRKTDKVGEVLGELFRSGTSYQKGENIQLNVPQARHALLEVIKAELPEKKELNTGKNNYGGLFGETLITANRDISTRNQLLTEITAILEKLFLGEEK